MEHIKNISKTTFIACYGNGILKTPLENKKKKDRSLKTFSTFAKTFISPTNKYSCYFSFHSSF